MSEDLKEMSDAETAVLSLLLGYTKRVKGTKTMSGSECRECIDLAKEVTRVVTVALAAGAEYDENGLETLVGSREEFIRQRIQEGTDVGVH